MIYNKYAATLGPVLTTRTVSVSLVIQKERCECEAMEDGFSVMCCPIWRLE